MGAIALLVCITRISISSQSHRVVLSKEKLCSTGELPPAPRHKRIPATTTVYMSFHRSKSKINMCDKNSARRRSVRRERRAAPLLPPVHLVVKTSLNGLKQKQLTANTYAKQHYVPEGIWIECTSGSLPRFHHEWERQESTKMAAKELVNTKSKLLQKFRSWNSTIWKTALKSAYRRLRTLRKTMHGSHTRHILLVCGSSPQISARAEGSRLKHHTFD